jgi:osmotically-inducible protein OsmY
MINHYLTAPSRVPMPNTTTATSRTVFDGGAHFESTSTKSPLGPSATPEQDAAPSAELVKTLQESLSRTGSAELRRIGVRIEGSHVLLSGHVSSFYLKQLAQEAMRRFTGEMQICNGLSVDGRQGGGQSDRRGPSPR